MRRPNLSARLQHLQSGAEDISFLFSIAKENFSDGLKRNNERTWCILQGCSCQD